MYICFASMPSPSVVELVGVASVEDFCIAKQDLESHNDDRIVASYTSVSLAFHHYNRKGFQPKIKPSNLP
jgi:hypothetical protein